MKNFTLLLLLIPAITTAQFSGYVSASYGFNGNPLYNYQQVSDQITQSYIELRHLSDFETSTLEFGYTGGLMVFNQLGERTYYEHSLAGRWNLTVTEAEGESGAADSSGAYLLSELKGTARHDKSAFEVFDNTSGALSVAYRTMTGDALFMRFSNGAEYRSYPLVQELTNVTDVLAVSLGSRSRNRLSFEIIASAGMKHYVMTLSDTSTYETITTVSLGTGTGTGTGKGHGNGKGLGNGNSNSGGSSTSFVKKEHLYVTPEENTSWQYAIGGTLGKEWANGSLQVGFVYRYNPKTTIRYVAQYVNTSTLSEDIYNDHFTYDGPEAGLRYSQAFPLRITSALQLQWATHSYGAPALTLDGIETGSPRKDTRLSLELTVSKAIAISDGVDLEINLTGSAMRNQSNDEYNDFSASTVAAGVGIGF
jgi:hypothetical protein